MAKKETVKKVYKDDDVVSFPVYMPYAKYKLFGELCKKKRTPMTKITEGEIDRFIKRETA